MTDNYLQLPLLVVWNKTSGEKKKKAGGREIAGNIKVEDKMFII